MFGDGKIKVINQDGDLYINMWEMTQHLITSAYVMEDAEGETLVSDTLKLLALTFCDLALYELGMETLGEIDDPDALMDYWESNRG